MRRGWRTRVWMDGGTSTERAINKRKPRSIIIRSNLRWGILWPDIKSKLKPSNKNLTSQSEKTNNIKTINI